MKLNQLITTCAVAATLALSLGNLSAQENNGNDQGGQNRRMMRGGFDPAQFQQRIMDNIRDQLGFTNDTDWSAVQPLVQKVLDDRRETAGGGLGRMFGGRNRGGEQNGNRRGGGIFGQPSPEADALQKAIDDNAPSAQIKDLLAKYETSQKAKQTKLEKAQSDLRSVLTVKQEAQATLLGLLN